MDPMPTSKKILNFAIDDSLFKRLDDFRFNNRINTLSEAIRQLLDKALKEDESLVKKGKDPPKP
jgi:metal-responsive CopG/Arc/MetJ family transcriptional regulator